MTEIIKYVRVIFNQVPYNLVGKSVNSAFLSKAEDGKKETKMPPCQIEAQRRNDVSLVWFCNTRDSFPTTISNSVWLTKCQAQSHLSGFFSFLFEREHEETACEEPVLGEYSLEINFKNYGDESGKAKKEIEKVFQKLLDNKIISGFVTYHRGMVDCLYFNSTPDEDFVRTALRIVLALFRELGTDDHYWKKFQVEEQTSFLIPGSEKWISMTEFKRMANADLLVPEK